ncbi:MAG: hypothetical protein E6G26_00215, partial [Actinobacteria bacterium]
LGPPELRQRAAPASSPSLPRCRGGSRAGGDLRASTPPFRNGRTCVGQQRRSARPSARISRRRSRRPDTPGPPPGRPRRHRPPNATRRPRPRGRRRTRSPRPLGRSRRVGP